MKKYNETDFEHLRSCRIFTIADLIGRYLIHRTPEEFHDFLIDKVQCSTIFTNEIMAILDAWTSKKLNIHRSNLDTKIQD